MLTTMGAEGGAGKTSGAESVILRAALRNGSSQMSSGSASDCPVAISAELSGSHESADQFPENASRRRPIGSAPSAI